MDMVIVGSIGYDDIQTPAASGSDLLGGAAVYSGLAASFHLRTMDEEPTKVGLVGIVGDDFSVYDQMVLEKAGLNPGTSFLESCIASRQQVLGFFRWTPWK